MKSIFKKTIVYILILESRLVLWKYKPKIIAITGSVGKTSTKDAVYAALSGVTYVRKSEKSFNSEIGLPLTILGCPNGWNKPHVWFLNILEGLWLILWPHKYPKWLVLEVGVGKPGDMRKTASWLKTDVVIMTAIGDTPVHIEFFDSRKHLVEEKAELINTLKKDGLLVLNADDETILGMKTKTKSRVITYGFSKDADVAGSADTIFYNEKEEPAGIIFRVDENGTSLPVIIEGVFGRNHLYASLATLALSSGLKLNMLNAINMLKNYEIPPGRMRLLNGINNSKIIDDTYNSSPFACEAGLKTLGDIKVKGRKIAVLGDMLELGKHTKEAHENVGKIAKDYVDFIVVVGPRSEAIKDGAVGVGMLVDNILEFKESREAGEFLRSFIKENDIAFIKGSQGMRMERTVEMILEDIENKDKLLVRQDDEWKKR
jgi:UDP-N-acetylmuramoyl-tripeptide--D-alanyl-D-alanine ligase